MEKIKKGRKIKTENSNDWGKRLSSILDERELSHRAAAKLAGVSPSVVDSWVQGCVRNCKTESFGTLRLRV